MSTAVPVTISISQASYERLQQRAAMENRTPTDLVEEALLRDEERREDFRRMGEAIQALQEQSIVNGTNNMTMEEINEEISSMHREQAALGKSA